MSFSDLHKIARGLANPRNISEKTEVASVAAALETAKGNIYTGVCIVAPSGMGFCAEHAAIAAMITAGETKIKRIIAVHHRKGIIPPCGRCREFICQIDEENINTKVQIYNDKILKIIDLLPYRWK